MPTDTPLTEKITININPVDLGYIDYLVSEGHYATRTEFIKTAVKAQLERHEPERRRLIRRAEESGVDWRVGVTRITVQSIQAQLARQTEKARLLCVGLLSVAPDVPLSLMAAAYESVRAYGVCRAEPAIKAHFRL